MNILVIGLGSMGRRRVRLLKKLSTDFNIIGIDWKEERRRQAESELSIQTLGEFGTALEQFNPECVIISTSPLSHASIIEECLSANCNVFTELNLNSKGYETNIKLAKEKKKTLFLSSTFLYREEIQYIENRIKQIKGAVNYNYHVGQYLPDWHPWETITEYFVSDKRTNGCRELFAIEFPWLLKVFGEIKSYEVMKGKNTELPIQYNDNYILLIEHTNGNKGMLAIDVVSRKAVRNLEIYGEELYLTWNGSPTGLYEYDFMNKKDIMIDLYKNIDKQEGYASFVIENAYQNELSTFLATIDGNDYAKYTFEDDLITLNLIDEIERKH